MRFGISATMPPSASAPASVTATRRRRQRRQRARPRPREARSERQRVTCVGLPEHPECDARRIMRNDALRARRRRKRTRACGRFPIRCTRTRSTPSVSSDVRTRARSAAMRSAYVPARGHPSVSMRASRPGLGIATRRRPASGSSISMAGPRPRRRRGHVLRGRAPERLLRLAEPLPEVAPSATAEFEMSATIARCFERCVTISTAAARIGARACGRERKISRKQTQRRARAPSSDARAARCDR